MPSQLRLDSDAAMKLATEVFQPSQPIRSEEFLVGRTASLGRTRDTLNTPGRSPFIYGVRGVGKTSLAQTAAILANWSDSDPIYFSCTPQTTFSDVVARVCRKLAEVPAGRSGRKTTSEIKIGPQFASVMRRIELNDDLKFQISVADAVDTFNALLISADRKRVVVVDELDVASESLKSDLAHFIKQIGDQECRLRFIFAGIAENSGELLTGHASASRYIATIELQPLLMGELYDIINRGFTALQIDCPERIAKRIACLSDGFAHFTHLLGLKVALRTLRSGERKVTPELFADALNDSIADSEAFLRDAYDRAIQKYQDGYELVLWAAADDWQLHRSTEHMYESYIKIGKAAGLETKPRNKFSSMLFQLKQKKHGSILKSDRASWYQFTQAMMRGYCRIIAASRGFDVGVDYMKMPSRRGP